MDERSPKILFTPRWLLDDVKSGGVDDWIAAYEDYVDTWFFRRVVRLVDSAKSREERLETGYAVLHLVVGFFEPYERFRSGKRPKSRKAFKRGFQRIFSQATPAPPRGALEAVADRMYKDVRCGLFHQLHTGADILLMEAEDRGPIFVHSSASGDIDIIWINPWMFFERVWAAFKDYVDILKNSTHPDSATARERFAATFRRELDIGR